MISPDRPPACPVCSGRGVPQADHPDVALYRCTTCDHCYTDPASVTEPESYDPDYFSDIHKNWFDNPHTALFARVREEARTMGADLSLIDVGCGKGDLLQYLHSCEPAWRLTGVDLSSNDLHEGIELIQGDILNMSLGTTYDVVSSLLVIEHIADAHRFVESLRSVCRPGGILIITTNDEQSVLYKAARLMRRFGYSSAYERLYSRHHLNHFSVPSLRRLLESHDLSVIRTLHHNIPAAAVDLPPAGPMTQLIWRAGVLAMFALGRCVRRTFLQTVVCRVPSTNEHIVT